MTAPSDNAKRHRAWFGMRNYEFETTNFDEETGEKTRDPNALSESDWRAKVITELSCAEGGKIGSLALVFHDRDLDDEGGKKGLHCHFVIEYPNGRTQSAVLASSKADERNLVVVRSKGSAYRYLTHTTDEAMKQGKTRYNVSEVYCWEWKSEESEGDGRLVLLEGEEREAWYREKIQGKVGSNKRQPDKNGALADMTVEIQSGRLMPRLEKLQLWLHTRRDQYMMNEQDVTLFLKQNRRGFEEDRKQYMDRYRHAKQSEGRNHRLVYISGHGGLGKSKLASDLGRLLSERVYGMEHPSDYGDYVYEASVGENGTFDPLGKYEIEPICVLDDLNPKRMKSVETFLKLFEPNRCPQISSRNSDVYFFADYTFVTKAVPVETWIRMLCENEERDPNIKQQVRRRFRMSIRLQASSVVVAEMKRVELTADYHEYRFEVVKEYDFKNARYTELLELSRSGEFGEELEKELAKLEKKRMAIMEDVVAMIEPKTKQEA